MITHTVRAQYKYTIFGIFGIHHKQFYDKENGIIYSHEDAILFFRGKWVIYTLLESKRNYITWKESPLHHEIDPKILIGRCAPMMCYEAVNYIINKTKNYELPMESVETTPFTIFDILLRGVIWFTIIFFIYSFLPRNYCVSESGNIYNQRYNKKCSLVMNNNLIESFFISKSLRFLFEEKVRKVD